MNHIPYLHLALIVAAIILFVVACLAPDRWGKFVVAAFFALALAFFFTGCTSIIDPVTGKKHLATTISVETRRALLSDATTIAGIAAGIYGGPAASAGLNALGAVAQGYVGKLIPSVVVAQTPGIGNMGSVLLDQIAAKPLSQGDVDVLFEAAKLASGVGKQ